MQTSTILLIKSSDLSSDRHGEGNCATVGCSSSISLLLLYIELRYEGSGRVCCCWILADDCKGPVESVLESTGCRLGREESPSVADTEEGERLPQLVEKLIWALTKPINSVTIKKRFTTSIILSDANG